MSKDDTENVVLANSINYLSREVHNPWEMFFNSCKSYRESIAIAYSTIGSVLISCLVRNINYL